MQNSTSTATQNSADDQHPEWETEVYSFSHDRLNFTMKSFRDENCQHATFKLELGGSYLLGGSSPVHPDAKKLDIKVDSVLLTLLKPANTAEANRKNLCGFSDWVTNKSHSVTDLKACKFDEDGKQNQQDEQRCPDSGPPEPGKSFYTIVMVEGDTLKTGDDSYPNCGQSAETRNTGFSDKARDILTRY